VALTQGWRFPATIDKAQCWLAKERREKEKRKKGINK